LPIEIDRGKGGAPLARKAKLNYHFHDPNTAETTAEALLNVLIKANSGKAERAIQAGLSDSPEKVHTAKTDCA
jgi:hypothetical protein